MSNGFIIVFKRCKCGQIVGCELGDEIKDGDLINHEGCELREDLK
jgi:hypothetical protein